MSGTMPPEDDWETPVRRTPDADEDDGFTVDVTGFEGPLDLLLALARSRKVDITRVRIAELANAYLEFLEEARRRRLDIAADYLVMAAWLAYLKSRLLLPVEEEGPEPADALARDLAFRLRRLSAMRTAADNLFAGTLVGRDVFLRGMPEPTVATRLPRWQVDLSDLLDAYVGSRSRDLVRELRIASRRIWSLVDARRHLERLVGTLPDWVSLEAVLAHLPANAPDRRSVLASTLGASLELAREGSVDLRQSAPFAPLYLRRRADEARDAETEPDTPTPIPGGGEKP